MELSVNKPVLQLCAKLQEAPLPASWGLSDAAAAGGWRAPLEPAAAEKRGHRGGRSRSGGRKRAAAAAVGGGAARLPCVCLAARCDYCVQVLRARQETPGDW